MHGSAKQIAMRPQTAATSTLRDETRIVNKLKYLEKIEQKIEDDLDDFINKRGDKYKAPKTGVPITKKIILEASNADKLDQVTTVSNVHYFIFDFYFKLRLFYVTKASKFSTSHIQEPTATSNLIHWST
jgi:hypothetical protein